MLGAPVRRTSRGREPSGTRDAIDMQQTEIEIGSEVGLDAPASARVARLAASYQCDVSLSRSGRKVNAKSLMGVAMLAAPRGSRVVLQTDGPDEHEALQAIGALIRERADAGA